MKASKRRPVNAETQKGSKAPQTSFCLGLEKSDSRVLITEPNDGSAVFING